MAVVLKPHQKEAIEKLGNGKILCGGVGVGKTHTAIAYYLYKVCGRGETVGAMTTPLDLYVITPAKKRDDLDWVTTAAQFGLSTRPEFNPDHTKVVVDSWNNIAKYRDVKNAFFIFDEQRLVGAGEWVKSFLKIAKHNRWILLSATPGDTWLDFIPVFIANGFYKDRTEFKRRHVVYNNFSKYPKVDHYVEVNRLNRLRAAILVDMPYQRKTVRHVVNTLVEYDRDKFDTVMKDRWNVYEDRPIKNVVELFVAMRRVVNSDESRALKLAELAEEHPKLIVFYNFNYELDILRVVGECLDTEVAEWNGHKHEPIPDAERWLYLVQYTSGGEAWNCTSTDAMVFYSLNYSYRLMEQAKGRIDRLDTPFTDLYYYVLRSKSPMDLAISKALRQKRTFNEKDFWSK